MTQGIKMLILKRILIAGFAAIFCSVSCASTEEGVWIHARSVDFEDAKNNILAPMSPAIGIKDGIVSLGKSCSFRIGKEDYYPGGPFQSLLKSGESENAILAFLNKEFRFPAADVKNYFTSNLFKCNDVGNNFLFSEGKMIAIYGPFFHLYTRYDEKMAGKKEYSSKPTDLNFEYSRLPFNIDDYSNNCKIRMAAGVPKFSSACSPKYNYYVATKKDNSFFGKLVGSHDYEKNGANYATEDYNNPVKNGFHPVFIVFPPLGDVTLVRVDDYESQNEKRDPISGVFLSIKDGKVVDQLNEGCNVDKKYICSHGEAKFKLMQSGQFKRLK